MTMRSTPPRSENFAEIPVPAPAPMIGSPASTRLRRRRSESSRAMNGMHAPGEIGEKSLRHRIRERGIVDVEIELDECHRRAHRAAKGVEQRGISLGVVEPLPIAIERTHPLQWKKERRRPGGAIQLRGD